MEISLRKPARAVFDKMVANPGSYLRSYKKSYGASRIYWRLMTANHSPIQNFRPSDVKPFFNLSILVDSKSGYKLKDGITLVKRGNKKSEQPST